MFYTLLRDDFIKRCKENQLAKLEPSKVVDWYMDLLKRKGLDEEYEYVTENYTEFADEYIRWSDRPTPENKPKKKPKGKAKRKKPLTKGQIWWNGLSKEEQAAYVLKKERAKRPKAVTPHKPAPQTWTNAGGTYTKTWTAPDSFTITRTK